MRSDQDHPSRKGVKDAVELRIQVTGRRPPIWRRVIVHPDTTLDDVHRMIALLLGWKEGRHYLFQSRRAGFLPEEVGYKTCSISKFKAGDVLTHIIDDGEGPLRQCSVKVVRKDLDRPDQLPLLVGGMRTLSGSADDDPYDITSDEIETELHKFSRYDELVPDQEGNMVEPWRAGALTRSDELLEEFAKVFPGNKKLEERMKVKRPLEPVPEKVPPGTMVDLKITLKHMPVPVWRSVRVSSQITFHDLHRVIQGSFGWADYHLYAFTMGSSSIESFEEDDVEDFPAGNEVINARHIHLRDVMTGKGWSIPYMYDFGDGWTHAVKVAKVHPDMPSSDRVELLDGSGACPPDDCGGPYGYLELIQTLNDPKDGEHDDMAEWFGADSLDPKEFDIESTRSRMRSMRLML